MKRITATLTMMALLCTVLLTSGCGALSKQRSTLPLDQGWEGPSGQVGDVRIILEQEYQTVRFDLDQLGVLFGDIHLGRQLLTDGD